MGLPQRLPEVDPLSAVEKLADGAVALDVREHVEWQAGRIAGALHIPLSELALRQAEIPDDCLLIPVCRSGNRSAEVTQALLRAGYQAENLTGGMKAWTAAGLPIEPANGWIA